MERESLEYKNSINWKNISDGLLYYKNLGFKYIEVPWLAPPYIMHITFPGKYRFTTEIGDLVASGEQSFLYLELEQGLAPGKYMTVTPCFRDEKETEFNFKQFMKLELYVTEDVTKMHLSEIIFNCKQFFLEKLNRPIDIIEMQDGSFDLEHDGIELGSYGIREHNNHKWIYATGIAEPRLSQVRNIIMQKK